MLRSTLQEQLSSHLCLSDGSHEGLLLEVNSQRLLSWRIIHDLQMGSTDQSSWMRCVLSRSTQGLRY